MADPVPVEGSRQLKLEAATLPIRGQEEKSAFGAMNGWCDAMPYVAGNYGDRYSVSS